MPERFLRRPLLALPLLAAAGPALAQSRRNRQPAPPPEAAPATAEPAAAPAPAPPAPPPAPVATPVAN